MKHTLPPPGKILYKYLRPETALKFLENAKLRFSPIIEFNDPFEVSAYPVSSVTMEELGVAVKRAVVQAVMNQEKLEAANEIVDCITEYQAGRILPGCPLNIFADVVGNRVSEMAKVEEAPAIIRQLHLNFSKAMGALCLTERYDNLLMWAHYAQDHTGVVIGIDPHKASAVFEMMSPVNYVDSFPTTDNADEAAANLLGRPGRRWPSGYDFMMYNMFTKSTDWKDEKEWRSIRPTQGDLNADHNTYDITKQLVSIPQQAFVSLHIGCRVETKTMEKYCAMARTLNPQVQVLKSRPSRRKYALDFAPIDENWPQLPYDDKFRLVVKDEHYKIVVDNEKSQQ